MLAILVTALALLSADADDIKPIPRRLPPEGMAIPPSIEKELREAAEALRKRFEKAQSRPEPTAAWKKQSRQDAGDILIFAKAVEFALRHREFYSEKDFSTARLLLAEGQRRCDALANGERPWLTQKGRVIRGYLSVIDDSPQPVGFEIPEDVEIPPAQYQLNAPAVGEKAPPLYVWLHGRGDKQTDLHFIHERMTKAGQIQPKGAMVVHPFGRHCLGFKSAGEADVFEACGLAKSYGIDPRKMVLIGFSMGGAGAWHLGAHYPFHWAAIAPGAGFAETQRYQKLDPAKVPWYERTLWGQYDAPAYARNLLNRPLIAYSGEIDPQKQAADVMAEAIFAQGGELKHLIGPGMPHKYHPDSLKEILAFTAAACERAPPAKPEAVHFQTRTLRYTGSRGVVIQELEEHWHDSRIDAKLDEQGTLDIATQNVRSVFIGPPFFQVGRTCVIDDQMLTLAPTDGEHSPFLVRRDGKWQFRNTEDFFRYAKAPGCQGPIDDAFSRGPFLVVRPTGKCRSPAVQKWVDFELAHFLDRWRATFRGEARVKNDVDLKREDFAPGQHLILWGDDRSNQLIAKLNGHLPIRWEGNDVIVGPRKFDASGHIPLFVCGSPPEVVDLLSQKRLNQQYIVFNSGPTFREAHDATNSQQNPKLPDWAIVDLSQPPDDKSPGKIVAADFFDEEWKLKPLKD